VPLFGVGVFACLFAVATQRRLACFDDTRRGSKSLVLVYFFSVLLLVVMVIMAPIWIEILVDVATATIVVRLTLHSNSFLERIENVKHGPP
jgi:hypothetical protein